MTIIEAVYEAGVLRPLEPLALAEGARVEVFFFENGVKGTPPKQRDPRTPAEILAAIAALSVRHEGEETASRDHDQILYGGEKGVR